MFYEQAPYITAYITSAFGSLPPNKKYFPLSGLEQREGYLGRDDTNRHKWRLRHALGDG